MRKPIGKLNSKNSVRKLRRCLSVRKKVQGQADRPRLAVNKGHSNLRVQAIDDSIGKTLFSVQTFGKKKG